MSLPQQKFVHLKLFYTESKKSQIEIQDIFNNLEQSKGESYFYHVLFLKLHLLHAQALALNFGAIESMAKVLSDIFFQVKLGNLDLNDASFNATKEGIKILGELIEALNTGEKIKYLFCKTQMGEILKEDAKLGKSQTL